MARTSGWLVLAGAALLSAFVRPADAQQTLIDREFRQIGTQGMGDKHNSYAWICEQFDDQMIFGSNRDFLCLVQDLIGTGKAEQTPELPLVCPDPLIDNDWRGRMFVYDPATNTVRLAYLSPTLMQLQSDGTIVEVARDAGYRTAASFREADGTLALYIGGFNSRQLPQPPARMLRTTDLIHFEEVKTPYSDDPGFTAFRSAYVYKDRFYICVIGAAAADSVLIAATHPERGEFEVVHEPFFGDPTNDAPYRLMEFKGYLYVGMANALTGYQLLRTQADGTPPFQYSTILKYGAYRGQLNENVVSLQAFNDWLYVGSGILFGGYDVIREVGPAPAEMVRVDASGKWDLICGTPRDTPDGPKEPLTGEGPGFGNPFTGYMWIMDVFENLLYLGTFDSSYIMQYVDGVPASELTDLAQSKLDALDPTLFPLPPIDPNGTLDELFDTFSALEGGFDFYSTPDGENWYKVSRTGFSDLFNYGVRRLEATPLGLYLGASNPFFGFQIYLGQHAGTDTDGDTIVDKLDNCPLDWNLSQSDIDGDGIGDACDDDNDGDCIPDDVDAVPGRADFVQIDTDQDGIVDQCDPDDDNDGYPDTQDNCGLVPNADQLDSDGDGVGDACDPEPTVAGAETDNTDGGGTGGNGGNSNGSGGGNPSPFFPCGFGASSMLPLLAVGLMSWRQRRHRRGARPRTIRSS